MVWLLDAIDGMTRLLVEPYEVTGSRTFNEFVGGLPMIVSGLKTLLETGRPFATAS